MRKKANQLQFDLSGKDAENLWYLLSTLLAAQLDADPRTGKPRVGIPMAMYELRETLNELRNTPDDELKLGSPKRLAYCTERNVSVEYFSKTMTWCIPRRLLVILKLVLKAGTETSTGSGISKLVELCKTLGLSGWFKKTFSKPLNIDLGEDDCELDDEINVDEEEKKDEAESVPCEDEKPSAEAAD